jgi:hypothetical protein
MTPDFLLSGHSVVILSARPRVVALTLCQQPQEYVGTGAIFQAFLSNMRDYVTVSTKASLPLPHFIQTF